MLYDQERHKFKIVFGDSYTDIDFAINPPDLLNSVMKFKIELDFTKGISLYCNNKLLKAIIPLL